MVRTGLSAARGFWKTMPISRPRSVAPGALGHRSEVDAAELEPLGVDPGRLGEDAGDGVGDQRLARPALADQRHGLAAGDVEVDAVDHRRADWRPEADLEPPQGDEGRDGHRHVHRRLGSSHSRSVSPSSEKQRMARNSMPPGKANSHHSPEMM